MNNNSKAIMVLCSFIGAKEQKVTPLQPKEWSELALNLKNKKYQPYQLLDFNDDIINELELDEVLKNRIRALISRSSALTFDLAKYEKLGIKSLTRADKNYPKLLKDKLGNSCPPILYYCGNLELLNKDYIGFVGSRDINESDIEIDHSFVKVCLENKHGVVSGGAKGIDSESTKYCLENDGKCLEILSDSMLKKLKNKDYMNYIRKNKLLCISFASPEATFDVGMAMMRNKFIYLFSKGTIVITTSHKTGGTWAGAIECIKKGYSPICVVNNGKPGNMALIKLGAKSIDINWNFEFNQIILGNNKKEKKLKNNQKQMSLFDDI